MNIILNISMNSKKIKSKIQLPNTKHLYEFLSIVKQNSKQDNKHNQYKIKKSKSLENPNIQIAKTQMNTPRKIYVQRFINNLYEPPHRKYFKNSENRRQLKIKQIISPSKKILKTIGKQQHVQQKEIVRKKALSTLNMKTDFSLQSTLFSVQKLQLQNKAKSHKKNNSSLIKPKLLISKKKMKVKYSLNNTPNVEKQSTQFSFRKQQQNKKSLVTFKPGWFRGLHKFIN